MRIRSLIPIFLLLTLTSESAAQEGYARRATLHPVDYTGVRKIIKLFVQVDTTDPAYHRFPPIDTSSIEYLDGKGHIIEDTMGNNRVRYTYDQGRLVSTKRYCCTDTPKLNEEIHFYYDRRGWMCGKATNRYTVAGGLYWKPLPAYDSCTYRYANDSLYTVTYVPGQIPALSIKLWKLNKDRQLLATYIQSTDRRLFEGENYVYDADGRMIDYKGVSNRSPVQTDGIVLFADHIIFAYDSHGRPKQEWRYSLGKLRSEYRYVYVH